MYFTQIVLLLYDIFNSSENHEECIKLGDVIVSEDHQLYKVSNTCLS